MRLITNHVKNHNKLAKKKSTESLWARLWVNISSMGFILFFRKTLTVGWYQHLLWNRWRVFPGCNLANITFQRWGRQSLYIYPCSVICLACFTPDHWCLDLCSQPGSHWIAGAWTCAHGLVHTNCWSSDLCSRPGSHGIAEALTCAYGLVHTRSLLLGSVLSRAALAAYSCTSGYRTWASLQRENVCLQCRDRQTGREKNGFIPDTEGETAQWVSLCRFCSLRNVE